MAEVGRGWRSLTAARKPRTPTLVLAVHLARLRAECDERGFTLRITPSTVVQPGPGGPRYRRFASLVVSRDGRCQIGGAGNPLRAIEGALDYVRADGNPDD